MTNPVRRQRAAVSAALVVALFAAFALLAVAPRTAHADPQPADPEIEELLQDKTIDFDLAAMPLAVAVQMLQKLIEVPILMTPEARDQFGEEEITLRVESVSAASVVQVLPTLAHGDGELRAFARDGRILYAIVNEEVVREQPYVKLYDLRDSVFATDGEKVRAETAADVCECVVALLEYFDCYVFDSDTVRLRQAEGTLIARAPARLHSMISAILSTGRTSLTGPAEAARNVALREKLDSTTIDAEFDDVPIDLVLEFLGERVGHVFASPDHGYFEGELITLDLTGVSVSMLLDIIFTGYLDIYWTVQNGLVLLSDGYPRPDLVAIVYDVSDIVGPELDRVFEDEEGNPYPTLVDELRTSNLIELLYDLTYDDAWDHGEIMGIFPTDETFADKAARIVVIQSLDVHEEIEEILAQIREYRAGE